MNKQFVFGKDRRIRKRKEYLHLRNEGKRFYSGSFVFSYIIKQEGVSRLGIVITKKLLKRAVWRNRIKRLIREVFRMKQYEFANPVDVVVVARGNNLKDVSFADVEFAFSNFIQYINRKCSAKNEGK